MKVRIGIAVLAFCCVLALGGCKREKEEQKGELVYHLEADRFFFLY